MNEKPTRRKIKKRPRRGLGNTERTPESAAQEIENRRLVGRVERKSEAPITFSQYQHMWQVFANEVPTPDHVARTCKVSKTIASRVIETGWPELGFEPLGPRLAEVRRKVREIEDATLVEGMRDNQKIIAGIKKKFFEVVGDDFENFGFDETKLKKITPTQFQRLANSFERLFRTEAYVHGVIAPKMPGESSESEQADMELGSLANQMRNALGDAAGTVALVVKKDEKKQQSTPMVYDDEENIIDVGDEDESNRID